MQHPSATALREHNNRIIDPRLHRNFRVTSSASKPAMSSITTAPGALTTIFTPPTSCFASSDFPSFWTYCYSDWEASTFPIQCYWSRPASCYPTGGISYVFPNPPEWSWTGFEGEILGAMYHSPGVLPFGFAPPTQFLPSTAKASVTFVESNPVDETRVLGCLSYVSSQQCHVV